MAAGEQVQRPDVPAAEVVTHLIAVMRERRAVLRLTQGDVAEKMGITRNHYQLLESGRTATGGLANPRLTTLVALAHALDVNLQDLMAVPIRGAVRSQPTVLPRVLERRRASFRRNRWPV